MGVPARKPPPPVAAGIDDRYAALLRRHAGDPDIIHQLGVFARRMYMSKTLGHFEIYKLVAHLPGDIVGYRRKHPDFPDETTADQFFDETQMEAYRMLGKHIASAVIKDNSINW